MWDDAGSRVKISKANRSRVGAICHNEHAWWDNADAFKLARFFLCSKTLSHDGLTKSWRRNEIYCNLHMQFFKVKMGS